MAEQDRIAEMFQGRTVLITGGSGFIGKALVEKILRRCHGVKAVYLLIRNKKGKTPKERLNDIFSNMLFDVLKKERPDALKKCKVISGDVNQVNLGISPEDRKILQEEVEFIYHSAASTRFDDTVRMATKMNTRGTKYMLDLAHECKNLKAFMHISTAYAYPQEDILYERVYDPPTNPHKVLNSINYDRDLPEEDIFHKRFMGNCPNTYTFSKSLAEGLVGEEMDRLPVLILRPSVVCPTWREPFSGWCNNLQGPMGLFVGAGKGIIRSMYIQGDSHADFVPADSVVNGLLVAPWVYLNFDKNQRVYNLTASARYNYSWEEIITLGKEVVTKEVPFNGIVWYPGGSMKRSKLLHNICFYLFQMVPAILIDLLLFVLGYKPILYQIQRRIQKGGEMFEYYTTKAWYFSNEKTMGMAKWMNDKEKEYYKIDGEGLNIREYFRNAVLCLRRNNLKESDDMLPAARRNIKIMWVLDVVCKIMLTAAFFYYTYQKILKPYYKL